jgi:hypothetical protein
MRSHEVCRVSLFSMAEISQHCWFSTIQEKLTGSWLQPLEDLDINHGISKSSLSCYTTVLNQNLTRAFLSFELTPVNDFSPVGPYKKVSGRCCNDAFRPPDLSGV